MTKIVLQKVVKELKLVKVVGTSILAVMVTIQQSFSTVTNPVTTINDRWPAVILTAVTYYTIFIMFHKDNFKLRTIVLGTNIDFENVPNKSFSCSLKELLVS